MDTHWFFSTSCSGRARFSLGVFDECPLVISNGPKANKFLYQFVHIVGLIMFNVLFQVQTHISSPSPFMDPDSCIIGWDAILPSKDMEHSSKPLGTNKGWHNQPWLTPNTNGVEPLCPLIACDLVHLMLAIQNMVTCITYKSSKERDLYLIITTIQINNLRPRSCSTRA